MKLQDVISKIQEDPSTPLSSIIKINSIIPILIKREIVKSVCDHCLILDETSEMLKCDYIIKDIFYVLNVVLEATDIEIYDLFDSDGTLNISIAIDSYDSIMSSKIFDYLDSYLLFDLKRMIDQEIEQQLLIHNSVSNVLRKTINTLIDKIPSEANMKEIIAQLPAQLAGLKDLNILGETRKSKNKKQ